MGLAVTVAVPFGSSLLVSTVDEWADRRGGRRRHLELRNGNTVFHTTTPENKTQIVAIVIQGPRQTTTHVHLHLRWSPSALSFSFQQNLKT